MFQWKKILGGLLLVISTQAFPYYFDSVVSTGNFDIQLQNGTTSTVTVDANPEITNEVLVQDNDGTLYLSLLHTNSPKITGPIPVRITAPYLNTIDLEGNSTLYTNNLNGRHLTIRTGGNSQVDLRGVMHIKEIDAAGNSRVNLYWVDGNIVKIYAQDQSEVSVAGTANLLAAELAGAAILHAEYLRTNTVLVKTQDMSSAEVLPVKSLSGFAYDQSNIYYYKIPHFTLDISALSGNVLELHSWR